MTDVDLAGAAALLGRSYSWLQRHWRALVHPATGAAFPPPYIGAERGGRPRWWRPAIEAWKAGATLPPGETSGDTAQRQPTSAANDPAPQPKTDAVSALLAAAGG